MSDLLIKNRFGFDFGYTTLAEIGEQHQDTGMRFGILKLQAGMEHVIQENLEYAYLLMHGSCEFELNGEMITATRDCLFESAPWVLHLAPNQLARIRAITPVEFAVCATQNSKTFLSCIYNGDNLLENEFRGQGLLNDTACRIVRTVFDTRNAPNANLVLGEVITAPGRWSSYPPHHHVHPEIYHYRFTEPHGYGHAECGEHVYKVEQYDTYKILDEADHAQTAAPGYGMYYLWVIRHLENQPYITPTFEEKHEWTRFSTANERVWKPAF